MKIKMKMKILLGEWEGDTDGFAAVLMWNMRSLRDVRRAVLFSYVKECLWNTLCSKVNTYVATTHDDSLCAVVAYAIRE